LKKKEKGTLGNTPGANITKRNSLRFPKFQQIAKQNLPKDKDNINICYMVDSYKVKNGDTENK